MVGGACGSYAGDWSILSQRRMRFDRRAKRREHRPSLVLPQVGRSASTLSVQGVWQDVSANTDTIYQGLHCSRDEFDRVAQLSVEGVNKSAISRVSGRAWSTVARWLALASEAARQFNDRMIQGFELKELQADELRTFCGSKKNVTWVFTSLEVWSRLWVATVIGRRSYANTYKLLSETARRGRIVTLFSSRPTVSNTMRSSFAESLATPASTPKSSRRGARTECTR